MAKLLDEDYDKMPENKKKYGHISDSDHEDGDVNPDAKEVQPDEKDDTKCEKCGKKKCKCEDEEEPKDKHDDDEEECDEDEDEDQDKEDTDLSDKKKLKKKLSDAVKVRKECVKESLEESFGQLKAFGTLNESESSELKELFVESVINGINESSEKLVSDLLQEMENYAQTEVVPNVQCLAEEYISEEVIPSLQEDIEKYLTYMAEELAEEFAEKKMIVKSRSSIQAEDFCNKMIDLIHESLQIIPEQEDAMDVLESENSNLKEKLETAITEKVKTRLELREAEKAIWVLKNIPSDLSEAAHEDVLNRVFDIDADDFDTFKTCASEIFSECVKDTKETVTNVIKEDKIEAHQVATPDFIKKASRLL